MSRGRLLIAEPPMQLLPTLAAAVGVNPAIVLQQLHYHSRRSHDDGWVQRSIVEWHAHDFWFMSLSTVERAFGDLRRLGLLETEIVPTRKGRAARLRIHDQTLAELENKAGGSRQIDGTPSPQFDGTHTVNLTGPPTNRGKAEVGSRSSKAASTPRDPLNPPGDESAIELVMSTWRESTAHPKAVLDSKRRKIIARALASHGLDDCLAAVVGWRHFAHNRGENDRGRPFNGIDLLLRDAEHIERFRDAELAHRARGSVATGARSIVDRLDRRRAA